MPKTAGARTAQPQQRCTCEQCSHTVPVELMAKKGNGKRAAICKRCDNARRRAIYWSNPEAARSKCREIRLRIIEKARARARERARTEQGRESNRRTVARYRKTHPETGAAQREAQKAARSNARTPARSSDAIAGTDCMHITTAPIARSMWCFYARAPTTSTSIIAVRCA